MKTRRSPKNQERLWHALGGNVAATQKPKTQSPEKRWRRKSSREQSAENCRRWLAQQTRQPIPLSTS